jgi:hypothetical protein
MILSFGSFLSLMIFDFSFLLSQKTSILKTSLIFGGSGFPRRAGSFKGPHILL